MFIRAKPRVLKSGKKGNTFSLAVSYRVNGDPKQRTILNLGQDFKIPRDRWKTLTRMVEDDLRGAPRLPFGEQTMEDACKDIVQRLKAKNYDIHAPQDDRDFIITHEIEHTDSRTVGGERVALKALQLLGFAPLLESLGFKKDHIDWATALVIGRMLSPGSEVHTHQWMTQYSSILELLSATCPSARTLYDIGDRIYQNHEAIMERLFGNTKNLLGFNDSIILYDLTNTFYMGSAHGPILKLGRSKEKRSDLPLVTLAVVLDGSGFPRRAKIFPGNVSEPSTLKQVMDQVDNKQPTVIMDAGIASEANLAYLKEQNLNWLCVERKKTPTVPKTKPDKVFRTTTNTQVRAWALGVDNKEQRVYLHSESRQYKNDQILERKRTEFEASIAYLNEGLTVKGRPKNQQVIEKKVGKLTHKYRKVARQYDVKVVQKKDHSNAERIQIKRRSAYDEYSDASGGYILRTSHTDWDCETVARTYWRLGEIEQTFRSMKSDLGLRPFYHRSQAQIEAHLFLSILAFHTAHLIRCKLRAQGVFHSWGRLKVSLNHQTRITTVLPQNKTHCILLKQDVKLKPLQRKIFQAMGLKLGKNALKIKAKRPPQED